jgi:hypothetical protein
MPYYLMIVASPEQVPFEFQYALDVHYAVGRLDFHGSTRDDTLLMHARYARSVVDAESGAWGLPRQAVIFSALNKSDMTTTLLASTLIHPMLEELRRDDLTVDDWQVTPVLGELATRSSLLRLLGGDRTPALLFSASHGLGFKMDDDRQRAEQGALVCSDWQAGQPIAPEMCVAAHDIGPDANPLGMIVFMVGEYGAGTPQYANRPGDTRQQVARHPFVSALAQRLLSHPNGGALAVIGHVDVSWMFTFEQFTQGPSGEQRWKSEGNTTFINTVSRLVRGHTVGSAMEFFNVRYAQAAADLVDALLNPAGLSDRQRERLMIETIDIRNYIILGDPAVRLPVDALVPDERPVIHVDPSMAGAIDAAPPPESPLQVVEADAAELESPVPVAAVAAPAPPAPASSTSAAPAAVSPAPVPAPLAVFNGIDARTGQYFYPPQSIEEFARLAKGHPSDPSRNLDEAYKAAAWSYFDNNPSTAS